MKFKEKTEVLHEVRQPIKGNEPFLPYKQPRMIVNISSGAQGSHNFFEGYIGRFPWFQKGDELVFQLARVSRVPMTRWERVWAWVRGLK